MALGGLKSIVRSSERFERRSEGIVQSEERVFSRLPWHSLLIEKRMDPGIKYEDIKFGAAFSTQSD